ncbi:MAG: Aminotransferase class-III [Candidatus Woesebacteria bacterium GW2011_GWC2_45_9]|uniref:Aminotransferase class-III n=1 Tax=Candidatus Woesebacteria bacterium GW2011_GWC2_45_9 TaxID=1618589 RepID=A0A0G1QEN7_9BACT|nr:MAG: Aminotransferase class-III [Candidatus Woesebacteria bacterium GW2011_GWC2_45_9]
MLKNRIIYTNSSPWEFNLKRAKGSYLWTEKGKRLLDFSSGWNVSNLGWNNPEIVDAVVKQAKTNLYSPMETTDPIQQEYAKLLTDSLPKELASVARATGGTEANEESIKTARAFTGRKKIIGFKDTYHGQSFGTMSLGYLPKYVEAISPMVPEFIQIDYPETYRDNRDPKIILEEFSDKLEKILAKKDVAAIVTEAGIVTGWGNTRVAPKGYLKVVRNLTKKYGTLMILDEVGTGFSRCGRLFAMEIENIVPDIVTFAKGISNGACAIGTMVTRKEIADKVFDIANLTSTFGWTPVACAAALKTLQIHKRDMVWEQATKNGKYLIEVLKRELKDNPRVGDIRGIGMEIGIELVKDKRTKEKYLDLFPMITKKARDKGLHLLGDNDNVIQLMPPLVIENKVLDEGIGILLEAIKESSR